MSTRSQRMHETLSQSFQSVVLQIDNQSDQHHVPANSETHFKVLLVSDDFFNQSRINRHRMVNDALKEEFECGLHALSLHLYTPKEWAARNTITPDSPACRGGRHQKS